MILKKLYHYLFDPQATKQELKQLEDKIAIYEKNQLTLMTYIVAISRLQFIPESALKREFDKTKENNTYIFNLSNLYESSSNQNTKN